MLGIGRATVNRILRLHRETNSLERGRAAAATRRPSTASSPTCSSRSSARCPMRLLPSSPRRGAKIWYRDESVRDSASAWAACILSKANELTVAFEASTAAGGSPAGRRRAPGSVPSHTASLSSLVEPRRLRNRLSRSPGSCAKTPIHPGSTVHSQGSGDRPSHPCSPEENQGFVLASQLARAWASAHERTPAPGLRLTTHASSERASATTASSASRRSSGWIFGIASTTLDRPA